MESTAKTRWKDSFAQYNGLAELWAMRLASEVLPRSAYAAWEAKRALQSVLNIERCDNGEDLIEFWRRVDQQRAMLETSQPPREGPLFRNTRTLCRHLGFNLVEEEILLFRVMASLYEPLRATLEDVGNCDEFRLAQVISVAVNLDHEQVLGALQMNSTLLASGLLRLSQGAKQPIAKLEPIIGLSGVLTAKYSIFDELFSALVCCPSPATLNMADFAHIDEKTSLLVDYLASVTSSRSKGRNVLLYGPPGTGKTELARLVGAMSGARLYEGNVSSGTGEPLKVTQRLQSLVLVQQMVRTIVGAAVLFDEVEDVFKPAEGLEPEKRTVAAADSKGWTVQLLENNPTPTIWISNRVHQIDPSILRRFDVVLEIPVPPLTVRRRILQRALGCDLKEGDEMSSLLRNSAPAPALLTRAAKVISMLPAREPAEGLDRFKMVIDGHLRAQGQDWFEKDFAEGLAFDTHLFNSIPRGEDVIDAIRDNPRFRVLIHGPSGSGKTAFAIRAARILGVPCFRMTVRDLWSANPNELPIWIRDAFNQAERDGGLLILDDMDWLAAAPRQEMSSPYHLQTLSWMYACLDQHSGPVICTIRAEGGVEHGILRRFGVRLKTDNLSPAQTIGMAKVMLKVHGGIASEEIEGSNTNIASRIGQIGPLTAGDFVAAGAVICKTKNFHKALDLLTAHLEETVGLKGEGSARSIGFLPREGRKLSAAPS